MQIHLFKKLVIWHLFSCKPEWKTELCPSSSNFQKQCKETAAKDSFSICISKENLFSKHAIKKTQEQPSSTHLFFYLFFLQNCSPHFFQISVTFYLYVMLSTQKKLMFLEYSTWCTGRRLQKSIIQSSWIGLANSLLLIPCLIS